MARARTAARPAPLTYGLTQVGGMTVLAYETGGHGRVVEVLGDLPRADHVAVVVPGNAHHLGNYHDESAGASPRANGRHLQDALDGLVPDVAAATIVWLGYRCPKGFVAGARRGAAEAGAVELRRLTHQLPEGARVTLIGHSYGSLVCALAADGGRVDDVVALASPGLGVRHVGELRSRARVWATRADDDWVRYLPRGRVFGFGHGRQPTDPGFGALTFSSAEASGHSGYYAPGSESLRNLANIVAGRQAQVTPPAGSGGAPLLRGDPSAR